MLGAAGALCLLLAGCDELAALWFGLPVALALRWAPWLRQATGLASLAGGWSLAMLVITASLASLALAGVPALASG